MKSLFKNSVYNFIYKFVSMVFPLISAAYVSRVIFADGVGRVSIAINFISYFTIIAALGLNNYGTREIGKNQNDPKEYSKTFFELITISLISTSICLVIYYIIIGSFTYFRGDIKIYLIVSIQLIFTAFNVDWFYQGLEEYKYITLRSLLVKLICLILLFTLVRDKNDYYMYALVTSLGLVINNVLNLINIRKYIKFNKIKYKKINIFKHLRPVIILLSTNIAITLYTKIDVSMLGAMTSEKKVGYYTFATQITSALITAIASISVILLPRLSFYIKNKMIDEFSKVVNRVLKVLLLLTIPCSIGIIMIADLIVMFMFGKDFMPATQTVRILSILIIIKSIGNLYGTQVLLSFNEEKKLCYTTILGAVVNISLNMILIPKFEYNGAAIASAISEMIVMIAQINYAKKHIRLCIERKFINSILISSLIMILVVIGVRNLFLNKFIEFILAIIVGVAIYLICGVLLKNETLCNIKNIIKFN